MDFDTSIKVGQQRVLVDTDSVQTLTRKALKAPIIDDFSLAQHTHGDARNGGYIAPKLVGLPVYTDNAEAKAGGLVAGDLYRTNADPSTVCVVYD